MRLSSIVLLLSYSVGGLGVSLDEHWGRFQHFVHKHEKVYETHDDFMNRWRVFAYNSEAISAHNAHSGSYTMEINKFTDRHPEELTTRIERGFVYNTSAGTWKRPAASKCTTRSYSPSDTPLAMDWEEEGGVTGGERPGAVRELLEFLGYRGHGRRLVRQDGRTSQSFRAGTPGLLQDIREHGVQWRPYGWGVRVRDG